jgi:hypothetical protein
MTEVPTSRIVAWQTLCTQFRILSAWRLCNATSFESHHDLDGNDGWLTTEERPLLLLFLSHRWDTPEHPDPSGQQLRTLQTLLRRICVVIRALFADPPQRLRLVPELDREGTIQAEELARRVLGYGPFAKEGTLGNPAEARTRIREKVRELGPDAFDHWMLERMGIWVDYCCMPQSPRTAADQAMFEKTLMQLDRLLLSSIVVALRREHDDYATRSWCVSEIWFGARGSFARSLFIDMDRAEKDLPLATTSSPNAPDIIKKGYESDLDAFRKVVDDWKTATVPLCEVPPAPWSAYRSLQGSALFAPDYDPNPARRGIEAIRAISIEIIERWWMSNEPSVFDLAGFLNEMMVRQGLVVTDQADQAYLALLLLSKGWIDVLQPFFGVCLEAYLQHRGPLHVRLDPIAPELRAVLASVQPHSAPAWFSRLSTGTGHPINERAAIDAFRSGLAVHPLRWEWAAS